MLMSAKTVSSNIIPIVNEKENRLCDISAMKVGFLFLFCFHSFSVNILPVLKSAAFRWCEATQNKTFNSFDRKLNTSNIF